MDELNARRYVSLKNNYFNCIFLQVKKHGSFITLRITCH